MAKVSDIPFSELKVGDKVLSAIGSPGTISGLLPEGTYADLNYARYDEVSFKWDHGGESLNMFHTNCTKIEYIGR